MVLPRCPGTTHLYPGPFSRSFARRAVRGRKLAGSFVLGLGGGSLPDTRHVVASEGELAPTKMLDGAGASARTAGCVRRITSR